ncbi:uncharacterized protein J3R85_018121 [Psidium guajava]|nr:uncharacterized protein J3R85_018121 [Psidium guajava]
MDAWPMNFIERKRGEPSPEVVASVLWVARNNAILRHPNPIVESAQTQQENFKTKNKKMELSSLSETNK